MGKIRVRSWTQTSSSYAGSVWELALCHKYSHIIRVGICALSNQWAQVHGAACHHNSGCLAHDETRNQKGQGWMGHEWSPLIPVEMNCIELSYSKSSLVSIGNVTSLIRGFSVVHFLRSSDNGWPRQPIDIKTLMVLLTRNSKALFILLILPKCTWNNDDLKASNKNATT